MISLVPLVTVMLALFRRSRCSRSCRRRCRSYFLQTLVPDTIARPVLGALTQFVDARPAGSASVGLVALVVTALALMLTIDRTLNAIWRVRKPRPHRAARAGLLGGDDARAAAARASA